jgi:hypothetical protein
LTLKGSTLRSRDAKYQQNLLEKFEELALPLLKEKKMKIEVHEVSTSLVNIQGVRLMIGLFLGQDSGCTQGDGGKQE